MEADAVDAGIAKAGDLVAALVEIGVGLGERPVLSEQGDAERVRVSAGVFRHLTELGDHFDAVQVAATNGDPAVAVLDRPLRGVREAAPDDDRRMRFLDRLQTGDDGIEIDEFAVKLGFPVRPDRFHGGDLFAHQLETSLEDGTVIFHLLGVPTAADAEDGAAARYMVKRRDFLGDLDGVPLDDQADPGRQLDRLGRHSRRGERDELIDHMVIPFRYFLPARPVR